MFEITIVVTFAAAHALRGHGGKCENVHGHNYRVEVTLQGEQLDSTGLLVDFADLKAWLRAITDRFDHRTLNDVPPFHEINPSAENIARYFYQEMARHLAASTLATKARVACVKIWETDTAAAAYRPAQGGT